MIVFAKEGQSIVDVVLQFTGGLDSLMHIIAANPPLTIESYPGSGTPIFIDNSFVQQSATLNEIRRRQIVIQSNDQTAVAPTPTPGIDPDAQVFITAGSITDATEQAAINELVLELKGQGTLNATVDFWTSFTSESWARIFPFVGGTIDAHKLDLLNPGSNNLVFYGGVTHDAGGINGNGTNGYYEIYPNSSVIPVDDLMLSTYVAGTSFTQGGGAMGVYNQINAKQIQHNVRSSLTTFRYFPQSIFARDAPDSAPFEGYYSFKTDGTTDTANVKGTYTSQAAYPPGVGNPNAKVTGLGLYYAGFGNNVPFPLNRTDRWVSFLPHLSDADETVLKQIIDQFQTALSRNV